MNPRTVDSCTVIASRPAAVPLRGGRPCQDGAMNTPKKPARPGGAARRATVQKRYLTYKLDLIKTLATKAADAYYVEASGMRLRELRLLRLVHDTPGVAATELRHRLVLDKTLLSKNLADLEKRGLIERETDPHDNRVQRLHLSAEGLRVWRECERIGRRLEAEMFADMPEDDWHRLHDLLDSALASLDRWRAEHGGRGT